MRRRLRKFLPIVLMALAVQGLAPIGACWGPSIAASDPLHAAPICSGGAGAGADHGNQTGGERTHDGACAICCVAHAAVAIDKPQATVTTPWRASARVIWLDSAPDLFGLRTGAHAQA